MLLALALLGAACGPQQRQASGVEQSAWAVIVISAVDALGTEVPFSFVDPNPVTIIGEAALPDSSDYENVSKGSVQWLSDQLRYRGIETFRALPFMAACDGLLVPRPMKQTTGCPSEPWHGIAFDKPKTIDGRSWILRMVHITYRPNGRSATTYEAELRSTENGFTLVRLRPLVHFD